MIRSTYNIIALVVTLLVVYFMLSNCYGQNIKLYSIKGQLKDSSSFIPFVPLALLKASDSSLIKTELSDSLGIFSFNGLQEGKFILVIKTIGYQNQFIPTYLSGKDIDFMTISLKPSVKLLNEVVVKGSIPLIEKKSDRLVMNLNESITSSGSSAWDVLKKAPELTTDEQGGISLRGTQGVIVLINERRVYLSGEELMNTLKNMNAADLSKIEIIAHPSAKYDAEGGAGIVNLVLAENKKMGLYGNINSGYEQTRYAKFNEGLNLNYRNNRINIYGNVNNRTGNYFKNQTLDQTYANANQVTLYHENVNSNSFKVNNNYLAGMDFNINPNQVLGILAEGSFTDKNTNNNNTATYNNAAGNRDSSMNSGVTIKNRTQNSSFNLNYQNKLDTSGKKINVDGNYLNYNVPVFSSLNATQFYDANLLQLKPEDTFLTNTTQNIQVYSARMDYSQALSSHINMEAGGKISSTQTNNKVMFQNNDINNILTEDSSKSNHFIYQENIQALYINLNSSFRKLDFQLGLRGERTEATGEDKSNTNVLKLDYYKLFPTLVTQYNYNTDYQYSFEYNRRINRPSFEALNPFRNYINPYSYQEGNPFLQPSFTDAFDFSLSIKNKYFISVFANLIKGQFTQIVEQNNQTNAYQYLFVNIDHSYNYGTSVSSSLSIKDWWESNSSIIFSFNGSQSQFLGSSFNYHSISFHVNTSQSFVLSTVHQLRAEINAIYATPGTIQGLFRLGTLLDVSAGIKKQLWNKKASLSLNFTDLFRGTYVTAKTDYLNQKSFINGFYDQQGVRLSFSYKFGKASVEKNRERQTGNEDEKQRIK